LPGCRGLIVRLLVSLLRQADSDGGKNGGLHPPYACCTNRCNRRHQRRSRQQVEASWRLGQPRFPDMLRTAQERQFLPGNDRRRPTAKSSLPRNRVRLSMILAGFGLEGMQSRHSWFSRAVTWIRAAGAANTLWVFFKSSIAAVYLWGPLLTLWSFIEGLREDIPIPYLLAACTLVFGGVGWSANQVGNLRDRFKQRYDKLTISYDRNVPSCRADVTHGNGSHSICFRLRIENKTTSKLHGCEGYLESVDKLPNISGIPMEAEMADYIRPTLADTFLGVTRGGTRFERNSAWSGCI
jgi:hypothetical protein